MTAQPTRGEKRCEDCGVPVAKPQTPRCRHCAQQLRAATGARPVAPDFADRGPYMTLPQICAEWGISRPTARRWRKEIGLLSRARSRAEGGSYITPEATSSAALHDATVAMYRRKAKRLHTSLQVARLVCLYSPEQLVRMSRGGVAAEGL